MGEPFKNQINRKLIEQLADHFAKHAGAWDREQFVAIACEDLEARELKDRCMQIVRAMEGTFLMAFPEVAAVIEKSLHPESATEGFNARDTDSQGLQGWAIVAVQEYVGRNGLEHLDLSMELLKKMTKRLTSEFGIRYFLDAFPAETLRKMQGWVKDPNEHVRRLVSEGTRPRLPWGMQLKRFVADPSPLVPLLDCLKDDRSEYVRRSVANNLNDISKDHPSVVCKIAKHWWVDADESRKRLIRHGLRTLIKKGDPSALEVLGYGEPEVVVKQFNVSPESFNVGERIEIELELSSTSDVERPLIVDYAVHFQKANGETRPKVFKWRNFDLKPKETKPLRKTHSFVPVTTRTYYPGVHFIEVYVNGKSVVKSEPLTLFA